MSKKYFVSRSDQGLSDWAGIEAAPIGYIMGDQPAYIPKASLKLQYDQQHLYGRFDVRDNYMISKYTEPDSPVSDDSCVEFFFAPNQNEPLHYFNLEVNAGGTVLLFLIKHPWTDFSIIDPENIRLITIIHSLPLLVKEEIVEKTDWVVEFKIPWLLPKKYTEITEPDPGINWRANFYKTAAKSSNPHYQSWNRVEFEKPNFHLPEFFGKLIFQ